MSAPAGCRSLLNFKKNLQEASGGASSGSRRPSSKLEALGHVKVHRRSVEFGSLGEGAGDVPPLCYLVQPVNSFAYTETGDPVDFNSPSVLATSKDGENYVYMVAPYEGCGGDGQDAIQTPDCFNSCTRIQDATNAVGKPTAEWLSQMQDICSDPPTGQRSELPTTRAPLEFCS